jgi:HEAT repeat protein
MDALIAALREGDDVAAIRAAIMDLGYAKEADVYPLLVDQLNNPNPTIQHAAVISLGRLGRVEAIEELVKPKIFRSPVFDVRWAAVAAVGKLGDYRVIDHLLKAVEDAEWIVRTQAVTELKGKVEDIIRRKDVHLAHILVHMLTLENEEIVDLAVDGFQELGLESEPLLLHALDNSAATIRRNAARALGKLRSPRSTPYLLDLLDDGDWQVRACAAEALGLIGDDAAIGALVGRIQDNVSGVRMTASAAIIRFGAQATDSLLNVLARERDKFILQALLNCLGRIGDPKSLPALIGQLRSSYFVVRQAAISALVSFGPSVTRFLLPLLSFNRSDIEILKKDAQNRQEPELQVRAIKALGGLEDHRAVPLLKELVEECPPDIQDAAVQALYDIGCAAWGRCSALRILAEVGDASLVEDIAPSLKDDSDNVRTEAVRALGKIGGAVAVKHLVLAARIDRAPFARMEAVQALRAREAGQPGVLEMALHCLKDESRDVRCQAARLLGIAHGMTSIMPLLSAMDDPHWSVRESAENALLNFGGDAVPILIEALEDRRRTTRCHAARLLGEIGDPQAIPYLQRIIARKGQAKTLREAAESSLRKLGGEGIAPQPS